MAYDDMAGLFGGGPNATTGNYGPYTQQMNQQQGAYDPAAAFNARTQGIWMNQQQPQQQGGGLMSILSSLFGGGAQQGGGQSGISQYGLGPANMNDIYYAETSSGPATSGGSAGTINGIPTDVWYQMFLNQYGIGSSSYGLGGKGPPTGGGY